MNNLNRLLSILFLLLTLLGFQSCGTSNYIAFYVDGYWNKWIQTGGYVNEKYNGLSYYGHYGGFQIYDSNENPWNYSFKFEITNFKKPTKEEIKYHLKYKLEYTYYGTVEYFVSEEYPNVESAFRKNMMLQRQKYGKNRVKRTTMAEIRIAPYKTHPEVYNIFFDDVGVAFQIGKLWDW